MLHDHRLFPLNGAAPQHAVILLHGLGDSGEGLIALGEAWRQSLPAVGFFAPDAPYPCDMAPFGFQWFSLQNQSYAAMLAGVKQAAPHVDAYIDDVLDATSLPSEKLALVGFSQGTMMSLYVAPRRDQNLAGVIGYSGALIGGETLPAERRANPPFLLAHGKRDDIIPFAALEQAEHGLHAANLNVTSIVRPDLGHSIDDVGLAEGLRFLQKVLT